MITAVPANMNSWLRSGAAASQMVMLPGTT